MLEKINLLTLNNAGPRTDTFLLMAEISQESCREAIAWILESNAIELEDDRPEVLNFIICSPGGDLNAACALVDIMRGSAIPVRTIGLGQIASAGLLIFMAGKKGMRVITESTSIMSHRYSWGAVGKSHELISAHKEFKLTSKRMMNMYMKFTGLTEEVIDKYLLPPEDVWLTAEEAVQYGIADIIKDLD